MTKAEVNTERNSNKKIIVGTVIGYVALAVSILSGLFFTPWIKKTIGSGLYGIYTLAISIMNLFLIDFGLSNSSNAYLSKFRAEGRIDDEAKFLSSALKMYLFLDAVLVFIFTAVYFCIEYIYTGLTPEEIPILKNVFIILIGSCLLTFPSSLYSGILKAYEEFGILKGFEIVNKLIYVVLTALAIVLGWGIYGVVGAYAFASVANAALLLLYARFKLGKKISITRKTTLNEIKEILSFSIYGFIASTCSRAFYVLAPSILGVVSDSINIGVFGMCSGLAGYVYNFSSVMSGFFLPKIARLSSGTSNENFGNRLTNLAIKVGKIQLCLILLVFIGFVAVGTDFVDLWLDHDPTYANVYLGTILMVVYQIVNTTQTVFTNAVFSKQEFLKPYSFRYIGLAFLSIVLIFLFGYLYGALGACIGIFLAHVTEMVVVNLFYKKYLGVSIPRFFKKTFIGFIPACGVSLVAALLFNFYLPFSSLVNLIVGGVSIVVIYASLCWIGFGYKETKNFLCKAKNKLFRKKNDIESNKSAGSQ